MKAQGENERRAVGIEQRGKTYLARVKMGGKETSRTCQTLEDAELWRAAEVRRRRSTSVEMPTLRVYGREALARMERGVSNRNGDAYAPTVIKRYRSLFERHWVPPLGARPADKVRRRDVQSVLDELKAGGAAGSTVRDALKPLQVIYRQLLRDELIEDERNPTTHLMLPRKGSRKQRIDDPTDPLVVIGLAEAMTRLGLLAGRERIVWALAFFAGLRMGEIRGLEWSSVVDPLSEIRVVRQIVTNEHEAKLPKGGKRRVVPILPELRTELTLWALEQDRGRTGLVTGQGDTPWTYSHVIDRTHEAWDPAGLRWVQPHEARHTFVSMVLAAGVPVTTVRAWSGHSDDDVMDLYTHVMPNAIPDAIRKVNEWMKRQREIARENGDQDF
jgi:integrase